LGAAPSDAKVTVNDVEIEGIQKIEMIAQRGKLTQVMLFLSPAYVNIDLPVWDIEGDTGRGIAKAIALELGAEPFTQKIYDVMIAYAKGAKQ
jgi:hypothetical protein